jgi:apolipoprotein N-acyltransferase
VSRSKRILILCGLSALSGLLLFLSDFPVHAWWIQSVALVPWLYGILKFKPKWASLLSGLCAGICYIVPLMVLLDFPFLMGGPLAVYFCVLCMLLSLGFTWTARWPSVLGALGVGAVGVILEWAEFNLVPVFGTAQSFARVWSACPWCIQFTALTGMTGLVFVLLASQALAVNLFLHKESRKWTATALVLVIGLPLIFNTVWWTRAPIGSIRVAAMGWTREDIAERGVKEFDRRLNDFWFPMANEAVSKGARLVISPETGFWLSPEQREVALSRVRDFAKEHDVTVGFGYFDDENNENHLAFLTPEGGPPAVYKKTHLIPGIESYTAGDGERVTGSVGGYALGGMICQDDNFTDLSRQSGRSGTQIVALPTNDWLQVKNYHLENSLFRPVENRYAIVRAATNGISVIATARGEVLARRDHFEDGPGIIVADLPVYSGRTPYAFVGDWPAWAGLIFLALAWWFRRRLTRVEDEIP